MSRIPITIYLLMVAGCQSAGQTFPVEYAISDNPDNLTFDLAFRNTTERNVCLTPTYWPNSAGKLNQAEALVSVTIGGQSFPISDFNTGYCPGCSTKVRPGQLVTASIPYSEFEIPNRLHDEPKTLIFNPVGSHCR